MLVWHVCIILAVRTLTSGRAAILGYTMPIFSAVMGALLFATPLPRRAWLGVGAAALGVLLLLWHELTNLAGRPWGVLLALVAAATWALGTQALRRTRLQATAMTITFWMTVLTAVLMATLSIVFERAQWHRPDAAATGAILFNAFLIFGFATPAWTYLAKGLPPIASTLSVMMIPVLGVFSGAAWLGEAVHWQDWTAVLLMMAAIASVLWPRRAPAA
jgi:drug/metabolite transporter (DMT)-like permease